MDASRERFITNVMNAGFGKAAESFSKLVNGVVRVTDTSSVVLPLHGELGGVAEESGSLIVLTTQIIGRISGKSFLVFSEREIHEIFKSLGSKNRILEEAFLLEIDNIISASVISGLSNALSIEVYGDVPQLSHIAAHTLHAFIQNEVSREDSSHLACSRATFHFENARDVHPQFIWKINSKVFDIIPLEKLVVL